MGVALHTFNPSVGRQRQTNLCLRGQSGLENQFQDSQRDYRETLSLIPHLTRQNKQTNPTITVYFYFVK